MNWMTVALNGVYGALALGLAALVVSRPKERRLVYVVGVAMFFLMLRGLASQFIVPDLNVWYQLRKAEATLLEIPDFKTIKQQDPNTYDSILSDIKGALRKGADEVQIISQVRSHMTTIIEQRLPYTSNETAVSYIKVMNVELRELRAHGGDICFGFLFPQHAGRVDGSKYFSKQTRGINLGALAYVLHASALNHRSIPRESEVAPKLEAIYRDLQKEYGSDLSMLNNPTAPGVDKAKVCSITAGLYSRILRLPDNESGKIIRYIFAQT